MCESGRTCVCWNTWQCVYCSVIIFDMQLKDNFTTTGVFFCGIRAFIPNDNSIEVYLFVVLTSTLSLRRRNQC